jgi:hypothetical protein
MANKPERKPWEFFAVEARYVDKKESVTLALLPRDMTKVDKDAWLRSHIQDDDTTASPFAVFIVPVTLH